MGDSDMPFPGATEVCDECGTLLVYGPGLLEYDAADLEDDEEEPELVDGYEVADMQWCSNLACQSNHLHQGFAQTAPDFYRCNVCGEEMRWIAVGAHRQLH